MAPFSGWSHRRRAALVAGVWALTAALVAFGKQQCSVAAVLHRPCPGCGMTRAATLLLHGHLAESFAMHPLVVPIVASWAMIAWTTTLATLRGGAPWAAWQTRSGRAAVVVTVLAYVALVVLWALREAGHFGGPVPV